MSKAVQDVSQQGYAQIEALQEKQKTLSFLQVHLVESVINISNVITHHTVATSVWHTVD